MPFVPASSAGRLASSQARNSARNDSASGGYVKCIPRPVSLRDANSLLDLSATVRPNSTNCWVGMRSLVDAAAGELVFDLALLGDVLGVELLGRADAAVDLELAHDVDLAERLVHVRR